ncbi:hypothetical protein [Actinokineospora pegani]|uniref:hypothetical protein n=1 Tax=Actinokineospora pegani TaxID=2654637 RepID=UPI0012EA5A1D|nr:hypothetical protein [Actinokineospora pegani]
MSAKTTKQDSGEKAASALIAAGAVLPGVGAAGDDRDTITARRYTHPALEGRVVVRLVPQVLGVAEDLTAEFLGFDAPDRAEGVGTGRRSALGFPAWALINDPDNAHHALNLVKDVEKLARTARSRAGAAKDGFTALGEMLGRSAPHFLPTFYEQAGRVFLEHGNQTYAATMFGKAREAEEVHDLQVDPDRIREVFLEFAFAGALTAKALSAHAKGLARKHDPVAAYELFRTLCVERTRGGLAPYTGMPEDLRRLAKAAELDLAAEDERLLRAILDSSAINRAGAGFWKSYRAAVVRLATADAAVRAQLLTFVPDAAAAIDPWISILEECGATAALTAARPRAGDTVSPARWLSSAVASRAGTWSEVSRSAALLDLVERMGPRLVADGVAVEAVHGWRQREVDLLDLLLALGVPIVRKERRQMQLLVGKWLADEEPGRRDLTALAADPDMLSALATGLLGHAKDTAGKGAMGVETVQTAMSVPGLRAALRHWIVERAEAEPSTGLLVLGNRLDALRVVGTPEAFADVPDAAAAIAATDVVGALAATLRAGLLDEVGWAALDETVTRLRAGAGKDGRVEVCGEGWPALVLRCGERFVVVGPDGVLAEHTSRIPADDRHEWRFSPRASWFDGVLLVRWNGRERDQAYWSDAPDTIIDLGATSLTRDDFPPSIALPGGGRWAGGRVVRPGDTSVPAAENAHSDGVSLWTSAYQGDSWRWYEVDPASGERGRASAPRFLEDFAADGTSLHLTASHLRPAVACTEASPLGAANGLHGWRLRTEPDGSLLGEGVDGRSVRLAKGSEEPRGLLDLPGGGQMLLSQRYRNIGLRTVDDALQGAVIPGEAHPDAAPGTPMIVPLHWWHLLRPRDEAGSAALRAVTDEVARALLDAAVGEPREEDARSPWAEYAALVQGERGVLASAVVAALPALTHPGLLASVVRVVRRAARLSTGYGEFAAIAEAARAIDPAALVPTGPVVTDNDVDAALGWFGSHRSHGSRGAARTEVPDLVAALVAATAEPGTAAKLPEPAAGQWYEVLGSLGAVAYRAASPLTTDAERTALVLVLRCLAGLGLAGAAGHWRKVSVRAPKDTSVPLHQVIPTPGGFLALFTRSYNRNEGHSSHGLQHTSTPGAFTLPAGWLLERSEDLSERLDAVGVERFLDTLAERGPVPLTTEAAAALAEATGLGEAEAAVLLATMPAVDAWGATYLDAAQRKLIGVSTGAAKAARQRFKSLGRRYRRELLSAALPADPARLWDTGPDLAAVADVWVAQHGRRVPVPEDVLVDAAKQLRGDRTVEYLAGIANPDTAAWLTRDAHAYLDGGQLKVRDGTGFLNIHFREVPPVLLWLAQRLPAAAPLRARLPEALRLLHDRVTAADFAVELSSWAGTEEVCSVLGIDQLAVGATVEHRPWLHVISGGERYCRVVVHPGLIGEQDTPLLAALVQVTHGHGLVQAMRLILSDGLAAACSVTAPPDTDPGAYHQDPTVSVPHLVADVAARHGLDEDTAVLYLQLLALHDPTDANVARWTGWKPARLRKARAALAETDLVLSAKRARAGRSLFLPGGWLALSAPHLPLERWKAPMFGFTATPGRVITPLGPVADLFTTAWGRVLDGDAPAYEELKTGGRR